MEKVEAIEFEDYSELEGELLAYDMDLSFLDKLQKSEIMKGITKYVLKVPKDVPLVEADSHISCMRHHRTKEGCWEKPNNANWQQGRKVKLLGQGEAELVACLKSMRLDEISYFLVDRAVLDQDLPDLESETLTPEEKKKLKADRLLDGYHRLQIVEEKKIKKNETGVSESVESRLKHIQDLKTSGNTHFLNFEYEKACKEYIKGFNLSSQFPIKKAEDENKPQIISELKIVRKDIINNGLKAAYKAKNLKHCMPMFEEKVLEEMKENFKYIDSLATIWIDSTVSDSIALDVSSLIDYLEKYVNSALPSKEEEQVINSHIKRLLKYENEVNILSNLRSYTDRGEEFERDQKIAEKIRQRKEAEAGIHPIVFTPSADGEANQN